MGFLTIPRLFISFSPSQANLAEHDKERGTRPGLLDLLWSIGSGLAVACGVLLCARRVFTCG